MNKGKNIIDKLTKIDKLENEESKFKYSPDNKNLLILNPYGWETMTNIYVYNFKEDSIKLIHKWKEDLSCKDIAWINNDELISILGYTYGTINTGGNIYKININNQKIEIIKEFPDHLQFNHIRNLGDNIVTLEGIEYVNDNYTKFEKIIKKIQF